MPPNTTPSTPPDSTLSPRRRHSTFVVIIAFILGNLFAFGVVFVFIALHVIESKKMVGDMAVYARMASARQEIENIATSTTGSIDYTGVCRDENVRGALKNSFISTMVEGAYICNDSVTAWAASVPLPTEGYYCIDSGGKNVRVSSNLISETSCSALPILIQ